MNMGDQNYPNAAAVCGWIFLVLMAINFLKLCGLIYLRITNKVSKTPEDQAGNPGANAPGAEDPFSLVARLNKSLGNDLEYTAYFMILVLAYATLVGGYPYANAATTLVVYGTLFVFARLLHTASYLLGLSVPRILGFILTVFINMALTIHLVYQTHRFSSYNDPQGLPNP